MLQPLLFLRYTVALSHLALFRDELHQFPSFQQALIDERLEASARPFGPRIVDLVALAYRSSFLRAAPTTPSRPVPSSSIVPGSGTVVMAPA